MKNKDLIKALQEQDLDLEVVLLDVNDDSEFSAKEIIGVFSEKGYLEGKGKKVNVLTIQF